MEENLSRAFLEDLDWVAITHEEDWVAITHEEASFLERPFGGTGPEKKRKEKTEKFKEQCSLRPVWHKNP